MKCVCGHAFNWGTAAVEAVRELAEAYERQHGDATAITCAQEVYDAAFNGASTSSVTSLSSSSSSSSSSPPPGSSKASAQATAWADNHPEELARARAALFAARHRPFAAQACVRLQTTTAPSHRDHVLARAFGRAHRGAVETVKRSRKAAQVRQWGALHGGGGGMGGGGVCGGDMGLSALYAYYGLVGGRKKLIGYLEGERRARAVRPRKLDGRRGQLRRSGRRGEGRPAPPPPPGTSSRARGAAAASPSVVVAVVAVAVADAVAAATRNRLH